MPSKKQMIGDGKASLKRPPPTLATESLPIPAQPQIQPASISQPARFDAKTLPSHHVLQLQRTIGNQAVGRLLAGRSQGQDNLNTENRTGLPDKLKTGVETLSGLGMGDVKVHYNSSKPAQLHALAYTQGTDIHVGPGQARHLPHEAWHVVQQQQGRVKPTMQAKGVGINDDGGLEHEADVMGQKALHHRFVASANHELLPPCEPEPSIQASQSCVQRTILAGRLSYGLETGHLAPLGGGMNPSNQLKRNYEETKMLLEELQLRYPGGNPPDALVDAVVINLNANAINTFPVIRQAVTTVEAAQRQPNTEPAAPAPAVNNVGRFIQLLTERRGAYRWAGGSSHAFNNWLNVQNPLAFPPPVNAQINCWEAVLISAAQAGLVTMGELRDAYLQVDRAQGVFEMMSRQRNVMTINHPAAGPNNIQVGDIIMIDSGDDEPLHHVVAALTAAPDYRDIIIMSLWEAAGGGGFTKTTLREAIPYYNATTIRYVTL